MTQGGATSPARVFGRRAAGVAYAPRPSAYVVVLDADRVACVLTENGLFLPGGGLEPGEDARAAVVREVREECARDLAVLGPLPPARQLFVTGDGLGYELHASFFRGRFGAAVEEVPEHRWEWRPARPGATPFLHACHAWAVARALAASDA